MQFLNNSLLAENKNYLTKTINAYVAYDLNYWPRNPSHNVTLKDCLFDATNIVKNTDQVNFVNTD